VTEDETPAPDNGIATDSDPRTDESVIPEPVSGTKTVSDAEPDDEDSPEPERTSKIRSNPDPTEDVNAGNVTDDGPPRTRSPSGPSPRTA
jgi:hypothetical protein